jgi:hypothetical protein
VNLPWWRKKLGHLKLSDITPALLVEHRDKILAETYTRAKPESKRSTVKGAARRFKRKPNTVNNYLRPLSKVFTVARKEWHWITHNPMDGVSKLKTDNGSVRFLSDDERERLHLRKTKNAQPRSAWVHGESPAVAERTAHCEMPLAWSGAESPTASLCPFSAGGRQRVRPIHLMSKTRATNEDLRCRARERLSKNVR